MTIAERRHLALLEHQHRQLTQACKRLTLTVGRYKQDEAITEIEKLLRKWELLE